MTRFSITTPVFYVNGPPHIGHAYSALAADVLARSRRLRGEDVFFLTGTDEHGAKIAEAAAAAGKEPKPFADDIAGMFQDTWKQLNIEYSDFIRTTEPRHIQGVQHALRVLHEGGHLYERSYRGLYCLGCETFVTRSDLDTEGKCPLHDRTPTEVEEKNWFFKLSAFADEVRARIERDEFKISPTERKNEVLGLLRGSVMTRSPADAGRPHSAEASRGRRGNLIASGVADFSISRPKERVPWAIPLPFDATQTCYVWVDALLNYVTALGYGLGDDKRQAASDKLERYWPADLHIIGQDILKFHAVYWPALLLALGLELPREIFVHGFFTVNGQKMSKSLHNAIDPLQLVQRYGSDAPRFLLLSQFPFGASGDVQAARFDEQHDAILANTIGNLVSRTIVLLQKFSDGKIPNTVSDSSVIAPVRRSLGEDGRSHSEEEISSSVAADLDTIVNAPVRLAQNLNQYADRTAPWKEADPQKRATALRTIADGIVRLSLLSEPLLPGTAAAIQAAFSVANRQPATPGTPIYPTAPPILFPRQVS